MKGRDTCYDQRYTTMSMSYIIHTWLCRLRVNCVILTYCCVTPEALPLIIFEFNQYLTVMPLLTILIVLIVAGVLLWLVNSYIPMDRKIKSILNIVVVIVLIIWLLKAFGAFEYLQNIQV